MMYHIYIVRYLDADGWYAPFDTTDRTLEDAMEQVKALRRTTGKCYGIANPENKILVHQSSVYYMNANLPIRDD